MTEIPDLPGATEPWLSARTRMATSADATWFRGLNRDQRVEVRIQVTAQIAKHDVNTDGPRLTALMASIAVAAAILGAMLGLAADSPDIASAVEAPMALLAVATVLGAGLLFVFSPLEARKRAIARSWQTLIDHAEAAGSLLHPAPLSASETLDQPEVNVMASATPLKS